MVKERINKYLPSVLQRRLCKHCGNYENNRACRHKGKEGHRCNGLMKCHMTPAQKRQRILRQDMWTRIP